MTRERTEVQQETTVTATPEEEELNRLLLERTRAGQAGQIQAQQGGLNLINQLLTGGELPGFLSGLPGGISEEATQNIVGRSLEDVSFGSQALGILDSGTAQQLGVETAANIRAESERFNIQNVQQLLNLALSGQTALQQTGTQQAGVLGSQLAGLRSTAGTTTQFAPNPFLQSFQTSLGTTLGGGSFGALKFGAPRTQTP